MICPKCQSYTIVVDSRNKGNFVYRRRECLNCGHRYSTREIAQEEHNKLLQKTKQLKESQSKLKHLLRIINGGNNEN